MDLSLKLNVFLTIDTELSVLPPHWTDTDCQRTIDRDIYGLTPSGAYGLDYQIAKLQEHHLHGSFFVESLCADVIGHEPLRAVVKRITEGGHEVQIHVETAWLRLMRTPLIDGRTGSNINDFTEDDQTRLIARAIENLQACGASDLCAFRAGNYGANRDTLRALARNRVRADTSYNVYYLGEPCRLDLPDLLTQPAPFEGVYEFPIAFFRDWPGHYRHVQLTACSFAEIAGTLLEAWRQQWFAFVLVSHSFELLNGGQRRRGAAVADPVVLRRFDQVCRFLADNRDKFCTRRFRDLDWSSIPTLSDKPPLSSPIHRTGLRYLEQLSRRL